MNFILEHFIPFSCLNSNASLNNVIFNEQLTLLSTTNIQNSKVDDSEKFQSYPFTGPGDLHGW